MVLMSPSGAAEKLAAELGAAGLSGSITNLDDLQAMVDLALSRYGRIDGVVLNTGLAPGSIRDDGSARGSGAGYDPANSADPTEITDDEWQQGFDMMFLVATRLIRLVLPELRRGSGGSIVAISTFSAPEPRLEYPVASCIRAGLSALIKLYADRFAREGIRINAVMPGFIDNWNQPDEVIASIPMARLGRIDEIAQSVEFLLSPRSGYITGQSLLVDGGINRSI